MYKDVVDDDTFGSDERHGDPAGLSGLNVDVIALTPATCSS